LGNSSKRQLDEYLTATRLRPLQREAVVPAVQRFQSFGGISQTNSVSIFVLCFTASRSRIPDDNLQSVKVNRTRDRNPPTLN
jgi:hypothetical protein